MPAKTPGRVVAQNRRARHDYFIDENVEAGIVLVGTEVKSLREGRGNLQDAYAGEMQGELYLFNAHIPEYGPAQRFNHELKRPRKLLVRKRERDKLLGKVKRDGMTLIPLSIYFNARGFAKVDLGLARGKKAHDKRETIKARDWQREKARVLRDRG
ncbi:SsrA-binding protein SmpB [Mycobacterium sp. KBS0706]|uniref:SsrA-binding protein SmpB n=1 Tax=Mycobacterium sp. KBS0706 TaxID=2578109 RepID=UPI00110F982D|nr:SsrA-binding protein SmpB [Mycobacterium sp. KBS0706]TSD85364.1 SsrA-binding protein SmpB [Mycobacterium sp. KBS0706]